MSSTAMETVTTEVFTYAYDEQAVNLPYAEDKVGNTGYVWLGDRMEGYFVAVTCLGPGQWVRTELE